MSPIIAHLDLDAFYAAVEELLEPDLAGWPLVIGAEPRGGLGRGVVATANYAARAFGIHSAMPIGEAYRRCPRATYRPPRIDIYRPYSQRVMALVAGSAMTVEQISIDEAFFDCGLDFDATVAAACQLQERIQEQIGLSASIGVGTGKLVAKIASDMKKPHGFLAVPPGAEVEFLAPLPVERIWGIGPVGVGRLREVGVRRIGDLAALPPSILTTLFGVRGADLARLARGDDPRPLTPERDPRQISREHTFDTDTRDPHLLAATLERLVTTVEVRMRQRDVWARTVTIKVRYSDFTTLTRRVSPGCPISSIRDLRALASGLLAETRDPRRLTRLLGVGVENLEPAGGDYQLPLPWLEIPWVDREKS